ncbi:MAG: trypsin-like peptidase domain-containing protein [Ktedonobacteraceae bacterium]|nr:trypsin-like peptidase domain-containing protein [Ktedonobacteraceae bacterium]
MANADKKRASFFVLIFPYRYRQFFRLIFAIGCAFFCVASVILSAPPAYAESMPGGDVRNPVIQAVDIARPAVVRIITTLNGRLTVQFSPVHRANFPQNGGSYPLKLSGSGAFISSQGDILTADHVVNPPKDKTTDQFLFQVAAPDVADYYNRVFRPAMPVKPEDMLGALVSGYFPANTTYGRPASEVYLSTDYTGLLESASLGGLPPWAHAKVDAIKQESDFNAKDTAIIHVNINDTPALNLGDSAGVEPQDELTVIGFPGSGDVSEKKLPDTFLTSSINKLFVSALKTSDAGAPVIQVSGNIEHGDSGGPALDAQGNIVGIVSFGLSETGGTTFLQASNSARAMVQSLGLNTTPGPFMQTWTQAFKAYASTTPGHWRQAQQLFTQIKTKYPHFQAVTPYLQYATVQAKKEPAPASPTTVASVNVNSLPVFGLILIALALLTVVLLALFLVVRSKNRKRHSSQSSAMASRNNGFAAYYDHAAYAPPPAVVSQQAIAQQQDFPPLPPTPYSAYPLQKTAPQAPVRTALSEESRLEQTAPQQAVRVPASPPMPATPPAFPMNPRPEMFDESAFE